MTSPLKSKAIARLGARHPVAQRGESIRPSAAALPAFALCAFVSKTAKLFPFLGHNIEDEHGPVGRSDNPP